MSSLGKAYVRRQVEHRFYAEALYFGALELAREPSAELHLYLGLACCGAAGGAADVQRMLHGAPDAPEGGGRPMAGNATRLVYDGFFHLVEAARRGLRVQPELATVGNEIFVDLQWYLREDFKGFVSSVPHRYTLREVVSGAAELLRRLLPSPPPVLEDAGVHLKRGEEIVDRELAQNAEGGDAEFYGPPFTAPR